MLHRRKCCVTKEKLINSSSVLADRLGLKVSVREKLITWRKLSIKFVLCKERQEQMEKKQRKRTSKPINKEREQTTLIHGTGS